MNPSKILRTLVQTDIHPLEVQVMIKMKRVVSCKERVCLEDLKIQKSDKTSLNNGTRKINMDALNAVVYIKSKLKYSNKYRESNYGNIPNRHERLFICGRSGKTLSRVALQAFYILSIIYLSSYLVFSVQQIYQLFKDSSRNTLITLIAAMVVSPIIMFLIWVLTIP